MASVNAKPKILILNNSDLKEGFLAVPNTKAPNITPAPIAAPVNPIVDNPAPINLHPSIILLVLFLCACLRTLVRLKMEKENKILGAFAFEKGLRALHATQYLSQTRLDSALSQIFIHYMSTCVQSTLKTIKNLLKTAPQRKGIVTKILILKPKKPNSANRKIAKVKIHKNIIIRAYIPGEGHTLHIHNNVLIKGGKTKDLPGINFKIIRGALDCSGVLRSKKRSKYGCKKPN